MPSNRSIPRERPPPPWPSDMFLIRRLGANLQLLHFLADRNLTPVANRRPLRWLQESTFAAGPLPLALKHDPNGAGVVRADEAARLSCNYFCQPVSNSIIQLSFSALLRAGIWPCSGWVRWVSYSLSRSSNPCPGWTITVCTYIS